jgi:hypothetical protein
MYPKQILSLTGVNDLSGLYEAIDASETERKFWGVTEEDALNYIGELTQTLGHTPTQEEIAQIATQDRSKLPLASIRTRAKKALTRAAAEFSEAFIATEDSDFVAWGSDSMIANGLLTLNLQAMAYTSGLRRGPSESYLRQRFSGALNFKNTVETAHAEASEKLIQDIIGGKFPKELFNDRLSADEIITRCIRYKIVNQLLRHLGKKRCAELSLVNATSEEFVALLNQNEVSIDRKAVQAIAQRQGVFRNMWRPEYIESLEIGNIARDGLNQSRGELSEEDKDLMESYILNGAKFIRSRGFKRIRTIFVESLQEKGLLPEDEKFLQLFKDIDTYSLLVWAQTEKRNRYKNPGLTRAVGVVKAKSTRASRRTSKKRATRPEPVKVPRQLVEVPRRNPLDDYLDSSALPDFDIEFLSGIQARDPEEVLEKSSIKMAVDTIMNRDVLVEYRPRAVVALRYGVQPRQDVSIRRGETYVKLREIMQYVPAYQGLGVESVSQILGLSPLAVLYTEKNFLERQKGNYPALGGLLSVIDKQIEKLERNIKNPPTDLNI